MVKRKQKNLDNPRADLDIPVEINYKIQDYADKHGISFTRAAVELIKIGLLGSKEGYLDSKIEAVVNSINLMKKEVDWLLAHQYMNENLINANLVTTKLMREGIPYVSYKNALKEFEKHGYVDIYKEIKSMCEGVMRGNNGSSKPNN